MFSALCIDYYVIVLWAWVIQKDKPVIALTANIKIFLLVLAAVWDWSTADDNVTILGIYWLG